MLVAPTIPAQQYNQAEDTIEKNIKEEIDILLSNIQNIGKDQNELKYYENNINNVLNSILEKIESFDNNSYTIFIGFILSTLISLIFTVIGTLFGILFGPILSTLLQLLTLPAVFLAKIISLIFS